MKNQFKFSMLTGMVGIVTVFMLSSFLVRRGGDSYTISVNGKQMIQFYVASKNPLPEININAVAEDKLTVYYSECGKIGTSRKLVLLDDKNKAIKEWKYANVNNDHQPMTISAKEMNYKGELFLGYNSDNVSATQKLAKVILNGSPTASRVK